MATRNKSTSTEPKQPVALLMLRDVAKSKLQDRMQKGLEIKKTLIYSRNDLEMARNEYSKWNSFNIEMLKRMFTTEELADEFSGWSAAIFVSMRESSLDEQISELFKDIDNKVHTLDSIIDRLELIQVNISHTQLGLSDSVSQNSPCNSKKIFVVHGHDDNAKTNLELFLIKIGLTPIVLHRQADEGLTIIEKFEKHSDVGYAFILLTPDEIAYLSSEASKAEKERLKEFRARPNVIFEFGYFVGKLGRSRVCCLCKGGVSLPSDVNGVIYKRFTNNIDEIGLSIIDELKASGYQITY